MNKQDQLSAEKASQARRVRLGESAIVRWSHTFEAPKDAPSFGLPACIVHFAVTSSDGLSYPQDLVMLSGDTFIIIPDFKKVAYVNAPQANRKSVAPVLAHRK